MKIRKNISLPGTILDYFPDEAGINALVLSKSSSQLITIDTNTFTSIGSFWINHRLQQARCIDENCFYIVTDTGRLIAIDKFSGIEMVHFNVGSMSVIDIQQTDSGIYSLCGIPINNGAKPITDLFCVCYNKKDDGKRISQSPSIKGETINQIVLDDDIWVNIGKKIYKISRECEIINTGDLVVTANHLPILTNKYILYPSNLGTIEVINKVSLETYRKILVEKNSSPPILVDDNILLWFTGKHVHTVNINTGTVEVYNKMPSKIVSSVTKLNDRIYAADDAGNLVQFDYKNNKFESINLSKTPLWKPIVIDGYITIGSENNLYQVDTND